MDFHLPAPIDRRVQRSREQLFEALFELMQERGYERLTIQNLIDRAGVGRATFYAHFEGKDELLEFSIARLRASLMTEWQAAPGHRLGFTLPFLQHLASHRSIYQMTVARESEVTVQVHIRRMLRELVREDIVSRRPGLKADPRVELATQYVAGALWSTIVWWMESGTVLPAEEVNAIFQRMTFPGLDSALGSDTSPPRPAAQNRATTLK
jgi:AcrR family transcriptional regulator